MGKSVLSIGWSCFLVMVGVAVAAENGAVIVPLTPELAEQIRKDPYVDESVQTTNGNIVGIFTDTIRDKSGKPVLGVVQGYDNVTRSKQFVAIPWTLFRFDRQTRLIQIETAANQLRTAPKYNADQVAQLGDGAELQRVYQHFGASLGGGSVAASMGSQSGQGSSTLPRPPTDEAQPTRGSVGAIYILGVLAILVMAWGYLVRRRT